MSPFSPPRHTLVPGIVRIGEMDSDVRAITRLPEDSSVMIERAK